MTYTLVWRDEARRALSRLRSSDPGKANLVVAAVGALATEPYPPTSGRLGNSPFRRLRLGDVRVTYDVNEDVQTVQIYLIGQLPSGRYRR